MIEKTYLLVDGMALAYRSFYGIKHGLATSAGLPTNALYGFIRATQQMREQWSPTHWQVVFDGGIPEARRALVPEYKAQRKPMPDEMRVQLDPISDYLIAAGIPSLTLDGEEADDVLATLAAKARHDEDCRVLIATSDKDLYQLVDDCTTIISSSKEGPCLDHEGVFAKTGVHPGQIVDWLALIGDSADNISGVAGVGPKTAAKWLHEHKTIDDMLDHLEDLKPERLCQALKQSLDIVERNRKMVKLDTALDCSLDWSACAVGPQNSPSLFSFYKKYELHSLAKTVQQDEFLF